MAATDYDFIATRDEIIASAFSKIGIVAQGQTLSAAKLAEGIRALQLISKTLTQKHGFVWQLVAQTRSQSAGSSSFALPTDPAVSWILAAYIRSNGTDIPIDVRSWRKYQEVPDKAGTGQPQIIAVDGQRAPTAYIWPVPTATTSIYYIGVVKGKDWDSAAGSADFPVNFQLALIYMLAAYLGEDYKIPARERQEFNALGQKYLTDARVGSADRDTKNFVDSLY